MVGKISSHRSSRTSRKAVLQVPRRAGQHTYMLCGAAIAANVCAASLVRLTQQIDEFVKTACAIDDSQKQDAQIARQVSGRPPVSAAVLPQTCCAGHNSTCVCGSASNPHTQQHPRTKPSRSLTLTRWCYFPRLFFLVCSIAGRAV